MSLYQHLFFYLIIHNVAYAWDKETYIVTSNDLNDNEQSINILEKGLNIILEQTNAVEDERVTIQLYYETLCINCIQFDTTAFRDVVQQLSRYLYIQTYPYGLAQTYDHNGHYEFKCPNGPRECYGNKLHACAIDSLRNTTRAVLFNSCMLRPGNGRRSSDDNAADACGHAQGIDPSYIKQCAKRNKGSRLLKYYGEESRKANFKTVPFILINGNMNHGNNFFRDVCRAFRNPPPPCHNRLSEEELEK